MVYQTGIELFHYEITISERGGLGVQRVTVKNLPHEGHPDFKQRLFDALLNGGIALGQHHSVGWVKKNL